MEILKKNQEKYKKNVEYEVFITKNLFSKHTVKMYGFQSFKCGSIGLIIEFYHNIDLKFLNEYLYSPNLFKYTIIDKKCCEINEISNKKLSKKEKKKKQLSNNKEKNIFVEKVNYDIFIWYKKPSESYLRFFANQIFKTMSYLNSINLVHLDIKLENFFVARNYTIKLGNFFLSQMIDSFKEFQLNSLGAINYMSPEYFMQNSDRNKNEIFKVDYFAVGVLILEMMNNKKFVENEENKNIQLYNELFLKNFEKKKKIFN